MSFGAPLQAARTRRGELGYSWMLVPSLLGPSVRAGQWSPIFRDHFKRESPKLGELGGSLQGSLQTHTLPLFPGPIWGTSLEMTRVVLGTPTPSPGLRFPLCDRRAEGRARGGARRTADEGAGGLPPRQGNGFLLGRPTQGLPARQPGTHRAGSRSPGPSPCPTGCAAGRVKRGGSRALRDTRAR